jgi:heat-inducible transcriptional repressor
MQDELEALSERERLVLQGLIDEHIATAEPVGSKAIASIADIGVSPATIRSVLAALMERGLIEQPHTSAGRVPTDRGLRYYVDSLLKLQAPSDEERGEIAARIGEAGAVDVALKEASRVLRRLSRHTTLVVAARAEVGRLKHLELLRLRDDAVLLILVTVDGKVQNRLLEWRGERAPEAAALERAGRRITDLVEGRTFDEARAALAQAIQQAHSELADLERKLLELSARSLASASAAPAMTGGEVHVEGTAHLLEKAPSLERTKELLALLEEDERVQALLEQAARAPGIRVFIGEENPARALAERGVVTAPLGPGGSLGVLGVIGPRHLDYNRVVPLVDLTAEIVRRTLQGS